MNPEQAPPTEETLKPRLELAIAAAREAGRRILAYYRTDDLEVDLKSDATPVTLADREAEAYLREQFTAAYPDDGILGEEYPEKEGISGFRWIIDPIDGTQSFIRGVPLFGTLVGLEHDRRSVIGVILFPALGEYLYAARGQGTWLVRGDRSPIRTRVSTVGRLADALFVAETVRTFHEQRRDGAYQELRAASKLIRGWGDCFGYALVASGRAEVMVDPILSVWDAAAAQCIVEEAGGTFTDWKGNPTIHAGEAIATNGHVLDEVLAITRGK